MLRAFGNEARLEPGPEYAPLTAEDLQEQDNRFEDQQRFESLYRELDAIRTKFNCESPSTDDGKTHHEAVIESFDCLLGDINEAVGVLKDE